MRVSFLIPLYNCLPLTQAMLASLQATLPAGLEHEIIFVDDGSTDGTRDWLRTLSTQPAIRVVLNERNAGYAIANNRAAALARGELLVLLNNDLVLTPRWLPPMLAAHRSLGRRAGLIGNVQRNALTGAIDHTGISVDLRGKPEHDRTPPSPLRRRKRVPALTGACMLVSRALWQQLGGFDERFVNGGEDMDLCFRARAAGRINVVALRSVIRHHVSSSPGRKKRDEHNSRLLAELWRNELASLGARPWCQRDHAERVPATGTDATAVLAAIPPSAALAVWLHGHGLLKRPPTQAVAGVHTALDLEFARWHTLLDTPSR